MRLGVRVIVTGYGRHYTSAGRTQVVMQEEKLVAGGKRVQPAV